MCSSIEHCFVAAVQVERRPGRPSLNRTRGGHVTPRHALLSHVSRNNNDQENRSYSQEKFLLYNSLDQFKQTLQQKLNQGQSELLTPKNVFDILSPAVINFPLDQLPSCQSCASIKLVSETSSRILFLSMAWSKSLPVNMSMTNMVTLLQSCWPAMFVLGLTQARILHGLEFQVYYGHPHFGYPYLL